MSGDFFQPGRSTITRQSSRLPAALNTTFDPQSRVSDSIENVQPGQALPSVVILTALPGDFLAVKAHLRDVCEQIHPETQTVYEFGQFIFGQGAWDVLLVETGQGNTRSANETQRAIAYFKPDVVLFVGTAGGRKDVKIGDVVAGSKIYNYESGKDEEVFRPRPEAERASYPLEQRAKAVVRAWLERRKTPGSEHLPRAFVGAIAAGESVIASTESETAKLLHRNYGDALAVEKEGYGFLAAARQSQGVSAIVIRGISNLLDGKEIADKEGSQELAARNASEFAFEILAQLHGSGSSLVGAEIPQENIEEILKFDLNWKPPTSTAILRFEQDNNGYSIRAHHSQLQTLEIAADRTTLRIELGQFEQLQPWTIETVGDLENYKPKDCLIGKILKWLRYLQNHEPTFVCLMIAEPPTSIVPWELLNLGDRALGLTLQTVRVADDEDGIRVSSLDGACCQGKAMVYTTDDEFEAATQLCLEFPYNYETFFHADPEGILMHWQQIKMEVGLIVMTDASLQQVAVGKRRFFLKRSEMFKRSSSLIMLQSLTGDNSHRALATELLDHGVAGVLGLLEAVDKEISQQIIRLFFEEYRRDANVPIPELLRRMRQEIAQRLDTELTDEMARLYLATSMYAYYGHPMTVLQLTPAEDTP